MFSNALKLSHKDTKVAIKVNMICTMTSVTSVLRPCCIGSQSSLFLLTWLADWLGWWVNHNLPSREHQGARMVYCPGSHTTENLFSTTRIPSVPNMGCDARQAHRPSPLQPGGKPPVVTSLNVAYSLVCASTNPDCSCPGGAARRPQIGLLWERLSPLADLGLLFSAFADKRHPSTCTYLSAGQSPLCHSIYLPG